MEIAPKAEPEALSGRLTLVAVGDCLLGRRVSALQDADFLALAGLLRSADCAWGNCEVVLAESPAVSMVPKTVDPHTLCEPWGADELRFLGLSLMGTANNHTMDFGAEGLASTMASLDRAGIVHAGAGRDLVEAARPAFLETATGRVALVNCASSFFDGFAAGPPHPIHKGRPGLNPLHLRHIVQVERSLFQRLDKAQKVICDLLGWSEAGNGLAVVAGEWPAGTALFFETLIQAGKSVDVLYEPWPADLSRILEAIQTARREARVVIASLHTHEVRRKVEAPSPFLPGVAHACLDAGADVFLATGPHVARGVEIYRGKPIFYSLGNFLVHFEALAMDAGPPTREPGNREGAALHQQRRFWQSFVPCLTFVEDGQIAAIELHPITLASVPPFGTPRLARGEEARVILTRLVELSRPFGTEIDLGGEVGRIRLN